MFCSFGRMRWVKLNLPLLFAAFIAVAVLPATALAQSCPENTYEISRHETAKNIRLRCACNPGTRHVKGRCRDFIPKAVLRNGLPMVVVEVKGKVRAYITDGDEKYPVSSKNALVVNQIVTGDGSHIVLQLPSGDRIAVGPNTTITFEHPDENFDLSLAKLIGLVRFDHPGNTEELKRFARRAFAKSKLWTQRMLMRRFKVRTPYAAVAVRGTDFYIEGSDSGDQIISMIEGEVDLVPVMREGQEALVLKAGQRARVESNGRVSRLADTRPDTLFSDWVEKTGLDSLPDFQGK